MEELAQLASWVTAPHVKKPVPPEKLLGTKDEKKKEKKKTTPAESAAMINDLMKELGVEGGL